jgi:DNA modification methylase
MEYTLHNGNSAEILKQYPANHFDSIVTDPPYGINFLGKSWDSNVGEEEVYRECLRVLKPGGHILAFSAARTYHHLAMTIEMAGFEIRDQIMWIYGSGFPKSQDVGKNNDMPEWRGWGTALKPAHEPICMARKPMKNSVSKNVQEWGVGAINIDVCRVATDEPITEPKRGSGVFKEQTCGWNGEQYNGDYVANEKGRFPANVIMDSEAGKILDQQAPKTGNLFKGKRTKNSTTGTGFSLTKEKHEGEDNGVFDGLSGASKFFYCPKVSRKERHMGYNLSVIPTNPEGIWDIDGTGVQYNAQKNKANGNNHPTVKPIELMKYLIKLITPPNGTVLDPFNGSGSTGCAAVSLGHHYTGIDLDEKYIEISKKRIEEYNKETNTFSQLFTDK